MEEVFAHNLANARRSSNLAQNIQSLKNLSNLATPAGAVSLVRYIDPFMDWLYGIALAFALLKDILDLVGIGSLPVIGTVITIVVSLTIGFVLLITGSSSKKKMARSIVKRYGSVLVGSIIESVFGINFLPVETLVVIIVFILTLKERSEAGKT